jgi:integrase
MRRGLGFKLVRHEAVLREFVSFLARKRSTRITVNLALEWATQDANHKPYEWAARLSIVRGFARHWSATDASTEVPPLGLLPYQPPRAQPYFYSDDEIRTLLKAAKARTSIDPLRPWTYHCLFGLLAVTGLRLGEALNFRTGDMDWSEGILTIRGAKFGKSRLVPVHASTCKVLADYAKRRDERFGARAEGPFLVNQNGNRLDKGEVHRAFYILSRQIGLRAVGASRGLACTIFGIDLRSRLCCAGIATVRIPSGVCQSCPPISAIQQKDNTTNVCVVAYTGHKPGLSQSRQSISQLCQPTPQTTAGCVTDPHELDQRPTTDSALVQIGDRFAVAV